jgi:hypothetical protein
VEIWRHAAPDAEWLRKTGIWGVSEMQESRADTSDTVIPFPNDDDPLDRTGQTILGLLQRAAGIAEKNSQHAMGIAHKLSLELRAAEDHIKKVETELRYYKDRSDRAEEWLRQISLQIEKRFPASGDGHANQEPARQSGPDDYAPRKPDRRRT